MTDTDLHTIMTDVAEHIRKAANAIDTTGASKHTSACKSALQQAANSLDPHAEQAAGRARRAEMSEALRLGLAGKSLVRMCDVLAAAGVHGSRAEQNEVTEILMSSGWTREYVRVGTGSELGFRRCGTTDGRVYAGPGK